MGYIELRKYDVYHMVRTFNKFNSVPCVLLHLTKSAFMPHAVTYLTFLHALYCNTKCTTTYSIIGKGPTIYVLCPVILYLELGV